MSNGLPGTEYFIWKDIQIQQDSRVFKISTDSLMLGSWVHLIVPDVTFILDAGTGTGILALMMAYYYPGAIVHALDDDDHAVRLAQHNAIRSRWNGQIAVRNENILKKSEAVKPYDLVICNPPFYPETNLPTSVLKARAKHHLDPPTDWIRGLASRVQTMGHLCLVLPFNGVFNWIAAANKMGLFVAHRMDVFSFPGDTAPVRTLVHFKTKLQKPATTSMTIYGTDQKFSEEYISFTGLRSGKKNLLSSMEEKIQASSSK